MANFLPGSRGYVAPGACYCAAGIVFDLQDALSNHFAYPRLSRSQSKSDLPAIHVEMQREHSYFCLEVSYSCSLVGSSDSLMNWCLAS